MNARCRTPEAMIYQHCPRCRLAVRTRATSYLQLTNCPRCLARAGLTSPMFSSPLSAVQLHGVEPEQAVAPHP